MVATPRRLITVAHSYVVALNRRLAHEMARAGAGRWEVTAVAPTFVHGDLRPLPLEVSPGGGEPCRVEPVRLRFSRRVHLMLYGGRLRGLLRGARWDVVHGWEEPYVLSGGQIAAWAPRSAAYVFYTYQNIAKRYPPPMSAVERYCVARCSGWIAGAETVASVQLGRGYGGKPHRVITLGVAVDTFRPDPSAGAAVRRELGWAAPGPPVVGYLGRFVPEKGVTWLTRVLDRLAGSAPGGVPPWRALFVGGGPLEGELRAWAARHGDAARVVTGVAHDRVPAHLNAMDVLAAPSLTTPRWREQLGRMLLEAFACGVPVVASDSGEIPYVVADAGRVVGESDEPGWASALADLLENPALRLELGRRGLDRARSVYAWPVIARQHLDFFEECLDAR